MGEPPFIQLLIQETAGGVRKPGVVEGKVVVEWVSQHASSDAIGERVIHISPFSLWTI